MQQQKGFTLIEIAIVLVIIGLLLGGVMKGQELINSAKVKNLANDFRTTATFIYAYQDRFRGLPGDQTQAQLDNNFGSSKASMCSPEANGLCKTNNGRIDGSWDASDNKSESFLFWQHIRLANLATGSTNTADANYLPKNAEGGQLGIESGIAPDGTSNPMIKDLRGAFYVCSANIPGRYVKQLDLTLDDGNTKEGALRAIATGGSRGDEGVTTTAVLDSQTYTVCMAY